MSSGAPRKVILANGQEAHIRAICADDHEAIDSFYYRLSDWDRTRLGRYVRFSTILLAGPGSVLPDEVIYRVVVKEDQIIAWGALNHARTGPFQKLGGVTIVSALDHRDQGLGRLIINDFLEVATEMSLSKLILDMVADRAPEKMRSSENASLIRLSTLNNHYYDSMGVGHNLLLIETPLGLLNPSRKGQVCNQN